MHLSLVRLDMPRRSAVFVIVKSHSLSAFKDYEIDRNLSWGSTRMFTKMIRLATSGYDFWGAISVFYVLVLGVFCAREPGGKTFAKRDSFMTEYRSGSKDRVSLGERSGQPRDLTRHLGRRMSGSLRNQREKFLSQGHGFTVMSFTEH